MIEKIEFWLFTATMGIITYFLKRTMNRVDKNESNVEEIKGEYVKKADYEKQQEKQDSAIKEIRDNYTPMQIHTKAYDEVNDKIDEIKDQMLKKDDFIREIGELKRSLERSQEKTNDLFMKYMGGRGQ